MSEGPDLRTERVDDHLDEMTCLLYIERQLDRKRGQEVAAHAQSCERCQTLLHALERESRLLTRADTLAAGSISGAGAEIHGMDLGFGIRAGGYWGIRVVYGIHRADAVAI